MSRLGDNPNVGNVKRAERRIVELRVEIDPYDFAVDDDEAEYQIVIGGTVISRKNAWQLRRILGIADPRNA